MNMQALMKQAQAMQKEIASLKTEIDNTEFTGKSSLVTIKANGKKEVLEVLISQDVTDLGEDLEMLQDMILVAINDAFKQVDQTTETKMGKYSSMMNGMM